MKNKYIIILVIFVLFLAMIPVVHTYFNSGKDWQGIVPHFVDDDLYYYARMNNIVNGYPFIGNPYYFEYRKEMSPAFFVADWLAVFPMMVGFSFISTVVFNFIFWSIIFSILSFLFFRLHGLSKTRSSISSMLIYLITYFLIIRPVSMQIVAPFFLFFCVVFFVWVKSEKTKVLEDIFLILGVTFSFYIYTYLWQVVVVVIFLTSLYLIYNKYWDRLKHLSFVCLTSITLSIPSFFYLLKQISSSFYWDSMYRIGLVNTHLPTFLSVYDSLIILVVIFFIYISSNWIPSLTDNKNLKDILIFNCFVGFGLLFTLFSNVITGKELEISNHIERFVIIWAPIAFISSLWFFVDNKLKLHVLTLTKKIILFISLGIATLFCVIFLYKGFSVKSILDVDAKSIQRYAQPLNWLNENSQKESVVWSNGDIGYYIPIMTSDFQLFNFLGGLHLMPSKEIEERYLVYHYFDDLSLQDIEKDFRQYAGVGNSIHQYKTYNRKVKICNLLFLSLFGVKCGEITNPVDFKGEKYYIDLYNQYNYDIKPNIVNELNKFNVSYIVKEKKINIIFNPISIKGVKLVWQNDDFEIYSFNK